MASTFSAVASPSSMVYGATGSLDIGKIAAALTNGSANMSLAMFGLVFIVAGLAFKLGAVPFHMWVPDVYQGAPTAVTLLIGGAPKLAAFVFVVRILSQGLEPLVSQWQGMLVILAVLSMAIGNITAIAQKVHQDGNVTTDPGAWYWLSLTANTVGSGAGTLTTWLEISAV